MNILSKAIKLALYGSAFTFIASAYAEDVTVLDVITIDAKKSQTNATEDSGLYNSSVESRGSTGIALSNKETPQSITVVTNQQMKDQNLTTIAKVLESTTGVSVRAIDRGRYSFSSRGFSIDKYQVDGMNIDVNAAWGTGETILDNVIYDRVEVIRGATGLMNGAGQPSASVNLVRKHADSLVPKTILEGGFGRYSTWNATLDHSQPLTEDGSVRARIVANHNGGKIFVDREKGSHDTIYAVVDADLSEKTKVSVGISHQESDKDGAMWGGLPAFYTDGSPINWEQSKNSSTNWAYWNTKTTNYFAELSHQLSDRWNVSLKANHRDGEGDSKLLYVYKNAGMSLDGSGMIPSPGKFHTDTKQTNLEFQLNGKFSAWQREHDLIFGVDYGRLHRTSKAADVNYSALPAITNFYDWNGSYPEPAWGASSVKYDQVTRESGIYAATRIRLTERLSTILGSRFSSWRSNGISYGSSLDYKATSEWTPYAGLLFDITPNHTLYVSYTDIFKPQQEMDINGKVLDPIVGKSYEVGYKASFFDNNLDTQISIFRTEQDNLAQSTSKYIPGTTQTAYYAADGARVKGFEIEAVGNLSSDMRLTVGYSQWRGYDKDRNAINTAHPRKQFKVFTSYDLHQLVSGLTVGAGVNWQNEVYSGNNVQGSYALVNIMARYQINEKLSAQVNVDNLFDKKYKDQLSNYQYNYGDPRYISASLRYEF